MYAIYKYSMPAPQCVLTLPTVRRFLSCGIQGDTIVLWFLVNPTTAGVTKPVQVTAVNTGTELPPEIISQTLLGRVEHPKSGVVWHLFASEESASEVIPPAWRKNKDYCIGRAQAAIRDAKKLTNLEAIRSLLGEADEALQAPYEVQR